ncbi:MAG: HPr(Ser) kinase/phosphatase [Clostridia bacterium]|nr:HPr(Ser) kinase/phosphatase [Clostridia bacterium]
MQTYVKLSSIVEEYNLKPIVTPAGCGDIEITVADVNRPSLQLAGFFEYFDPARIQIIGMVEYTYLKSLTPDARFSAIERLFKEPVPAVIITRNMVPFPEFIECAKKYNRALYVSDYSTSRFTSAIILYLNVALAPMTQLHGVLVEVYGEGILLLGESGVGKSETAIELVKRGHRLVADDAVEIRRVSNKSLVGSAPEIIRHFIELRGIGIVDVKRLFGMGAVKDTENIDLVINLENWQQGKAYDRLGIDTEVVDILGIEVPSLTIPIKPGRNLAMIVEVAAMNARQRKMGYNAAEELNDRMMNQE